MRDEGLLIEEDRERRVPYHQYQDTNQLGEVGATQDHQHLGTNQQRKARAIQNHHYQDTNQLREAGAT